MTTDIQQDVLWPKILRGSGFGGRLLLCSVKPFPFCHHMDPGLVSYSVGMWDREITQEAEAAKSSVLPVPGTGMVACCDHSQAFDRHGTTRETM